MLSVSFWPKQVTRQNLTLEWVFVSQEAVISFVTITHIWDKDCSKEKWLVLDHAFRSCPLGPIVWAQSVMAGAPDIQEVHFYSTSNQKERTEKEGSQCLLPSATSNFTFLSIVMQVVDQTFSILGWDFEEHSKYNIIWKEQDDTMAELNACFTGKQDARRPGSRVTIPTGPLFQELQLLWFVVMLWQMQNQSRSSLRYWVSKQSHLLSGNQWLSTLMEMLVFFVVLITNKSRIRKSLCSQCRWRFRPALLGEVLLPTFLTVSAAPGSAESHSQITCELSGGLWIECR